MRLFLSKISFSLTMWVMKIILHTDGGARGNPGPAGAGVVIFDESGKVLQTAKKFLGKDLNIRR